MKKIGLIGGLSVESTLYYYGKYIEISRERFERYFFPELMIYSVNFRDFTDAADWKERKEILVKAAKSLENAGAELIGITANTPHLVFPDVQKRINTEMLSIIDAVGNEAKRKGLNTLLLLGTKTTMSVPFYREPLERMGLDVMLPEESEMDEVNRIISEELMFGNFKSRRWMIKLIEKYANMAEGVILGCTELPLLIKEADVDIPVLDSAAIHMRALIDRAEDTEKKGERRRQDSNL